MGEQAQAILDGECCGDCGVCFVAAHEYPVLCRDCWSEDKRPRNADGVNADGFQVSTYEEIAC